MEAVDDDLYDTTMNSSIDDYMDVKLGYHYNVAVYIWRIVSPILIVIGMLGNLMTAIVIVKTFTRRVYSTALFLLTLAVSDTVLLLSGLLRHWIKWQWEYDILDYSNAACKSLIFIAYASIHFSSWILVVVTIERVISVVFPHKVKLCCTPKVWLIVVIGLLLTIAGINCHFFYGYEKSEDLEGNKVCQPVNEEYEYFFHMYWSWIHFLMSFFLPFIVLLPGNVIIIRKLHGLKKKRRKMSACDTSAEAKFEHDVNMATVILILLTVVFVVCVTPMSIYRIYLPYRERELVHVMEVDPEEYLKQVDIMAMWFAITESFAYVNAAINFLLYVLSGSKFRAEVKALFYCVITESHDALWSNNSRQNSRSSETSHDSYNMNHNIEQCLTGKHYPGH